MSSGSDRGRPQGILRQGRTIVGCISMPEASDVFIKEFNHCYGQLRLEVEEPVLAQATIPSNPYAFRLPTWFRHVWHHRDEQTGIDPDR